MDKSYNAPRKTPVAQLNAFTIRQDKNANIRWKTVARCFLLIGSDRASKKHKNGRGGEFGTCPKTCDRDPRSRVVSKQYL